LSFVSEIRHDLYQHLRHDIISLNSRDNVGYFYCSPRR